MYIKILSRKTEHRYSLYILFIFSQLLRRKVLSKYRFVHNILLLKKKKHMLMIFYTHHEEVQQKNINNETLLQIFYVITD